MEVCFWRTGNRQGIGGRNGKSEGSEVWPEQGSADAGEVCLPAAAHVAGGGA